MSVGSVHLPAKTVNTASQSPGLGGNGVGRILAADFKRLQETIRINERKARTGGVDADIEAEHQGQGSNSSRPGWIPREPLAQKRIRQAGAVAMQNRNAARIQAPGAIATFFADCGEAP